MNTLQTISSADMNDLIALITRKTMTNRAMIRPYTETVPFLTGLLRQLYRPGCRLLAAGHVEPDIEAAANRAEVQLTESIGPSPFSGSLKAVLDSVSSPRDVIYVANPNKVSGANYSLADLKQLAEAVPDGALIIDEYYHDFFGVTGLPLIESFPRVILLRSFASAYSIRSSASGFAISNPTMIAAMNDFAPAEEFSATIRKVILMTLTNDEAMTMRLREVHEESLRVASILTRLGAQSRITATDFLLIRVADPAQVGNQLARAKVAIENLDGYPSMQHYIRYRVQSPLTNDKLIQAFEAMPPEAYRMKSLDLRKITMRHEPQTTEAQTEQKPAVQRQPKRQPKTKPNQPSIRVAARHLFGLAEVEPEEAGKK